MLSEERFEKWGVSEFTPDEIETACEMFESDFGVDPRHNPSGTGVRMIRGVHARRGTLDKIEPPSSLDPFVAEGVGAMPIYWIDPQGEFAPYAFLHCYDKRASYLLASDCNLGVGEWKELDAAAWEMFRTSEDWRQGRFKVAGLWRLVFNGSDDSWVRQFVGSRVWFYTPMIEALAAMGADFVVTEGYYYPRSLPLLKFWREAIQKGLNNAEFFEAPAYRKMIKRMYSTAIGLLGSPILRDSKDTLYRPDWRGQIVDTAAARMLFNLDALRQNLESPVYAIYDDCFYVGANFDRGVYSIFEAPSGQLAKHYRMKGVFELGMMGTAARETFRRNPGKFAELIKEWEVR